DVERDEPERARRGRWLAWALVGAGAAAGLWLAALPVELLVPEPPPQRARAFEPPAAPPPAGEPEAGPDAEWPATAPPAEPPAPGAAPREGEGEPIDPPEAPPATEWAESIPLPEDETPEQAALRERL